METLGEVYESNWVGHDLLYVQAQNQEMLWADLVETAGSTLSPDWHGEVLAAREAAFASGDEESIDWEAMKQEIYEELK